MANKLAELEGLLNDLKTFRDDYCYVTEVDPAGNCWGCPLAYREWKNGSKYENLCELMIAIEKWMEDED